MNNLLIPRHLAQAILEYLATRPAGETFQLILGLHALSEAPDDSKAGE